jgi:hypothetical protein
MKDVNTIVKKHKKYRFNQIYSIEGKLEEDQIKNREKKTDLIRYFFMKGKLEDGQIKQTEKKDRQN